MNAVEIDDGMIDRAHEAIRKVIGSSLQRLAVRAALEAALTPETAIIVTDGMEVAGVDEAFDTGTVLMRHQVVAIYRAMRKLEPPPERRKTPPCMSPAGWHLAEPDEVCPHHAWAPNRRTGGIVG